MGAKHFGERKPLWAIDTGDGALFALKSNYACKTTLYPTRKEARDGLAYARQFYRDAEIVKVAVKYEVLP